MAPDHINEIERRLIDNLRSGTYSTTGGVDSGSAWSAGDIKVFGQFPEPEDLTYPCIVVEQVANGVEEQFMGQRLTSGSVTEIGELYGLGYNLHLAADSTSAITVTWDNGSVDTTDESTTATMDDTALLSAGTTISGSGIPAGATVASVTNATTFELSAAATATATNITGTFSNAAKQRRLLNYLMLCVADIVMDCDFSNIQVDVTERHYTGFKGIGYDPDLEIWFAQTGMVIVFKNTR